MRDRSERRRWRRGEDEPEVAAMLRDGDPLAGWLALPGQRHIVEAYDRPRPQRSPVSSFGLRNDYDNREYHHQ